MGRSSPGLRARLLMLVLFAVTPLFLIIGYTVFSERHDAAERAERDALTLVRLAAREHSRLIGQTRQLLTQLSQLPAVQGKGSAKDCSRALGEAQRAHPYYTNIGVASLGGDVHCNSRRLRQQINIADRGYFRRALQEREFAIGEYQIGRVTGEPAINFAVPVFDTEGDVRGIIYAALNLRWLEQLLADVELPRDSVIFVTDSKGTILTHYPDPEPWIGESQPNAPIVSVILSNPGGGTADIQGLDGVPRLHAFAPLHEGSVGNVYVAVGISRTVAYADANRQFVSKLFLLLAAAALVALAASVGSRVFVLRRVSILTEAVRRLGQGDLFARTGLDHAADEFGQLASNFDNMAAKLQRVNRALKTLSAGNRAMVRAADEQSLLNDMCRVVVDVGAYRFSWIGYAEDNAEKSIRPMALAGLENEGGIEALKQLVGRSTWSDSELGRGPVGSAIRSSSAVVLHNLLEDPNFAPWRAEVVRHGLVSCAVFPLLVDRTVIGALAIYAPEADAFDAEELELLGEAANDLAFGIANLRMQADSENARVTIQRMAYYDRLTGLPNHGFFEEQLRHALPQADAQGESLALLMLGLNRLREINDALGFHHGDLLLKDVGARIRAVAKPEVIVARLRGDEFALLLTNRDAAQTSAFTREILDSLRTPFAVGELQLDVSAAAGIALFPQHGADPTHLLRCADVAMQQAKKTNKEFVFYATEQDAHSARRLTMAGELRHAIDNGELTLHYQPKMTIPGGQVCGAEALVRWLHPTRGMIRPDEFISLAEHTGLMKPLTDWVVADALRQSAQWRRAGSFALPIAVNLSARNLHDVELVHKIKQLLAAVGADVDWLELEITEGAVMENPEDALDILQRLHEMGIKMFIDDFGTGYSSLGYLKKLPVDAVKIDKSFVIDMLTDADSAAIVRSTIDLAHDLDLKVVAEGVETQAMLDKLALLGCDVAQGYHFSKPLPAPQFSDWYRAHAGK